MKKILFLLLFICSLGYGQNVQSTGGYNTSLSSGFTGVLPLVNGGTNNTVGAATLSAITNDNTTNSIMYPTLVTTASGNQAIKTSSAYLGWNPSQKRLNIDPSGSVTTGIFSEHLTIHDTLTDSPAVALVRSGYSPSANGDGGTGWAVARSRGTSASPVAVEDNDEIGTLSFSAYSGVAANNGWGTNRGHITCLVDGVRTPGTEPPGRLNFWTAPNNSTETLRMTILGNGNVGIGTFPVIYTPRNYINWRLSVLANSGDGIGLDNLNNDNGATRLAFDKKRGSSIVQNGDFLSIIQARGYDGSSYQNAAFIEMLVDGTPGAGDMPGKISFQTTLDGAASPTERMTINNAGTVAITGLTTNGGVITTGGAGALSIAPITNSTYTFTLGNTTNIATSGGGTAHYYRYGDQVQVQGTFTFTLTSANVFTEASIPLPINTLVNFSRNDMGSGQGIAQNAGTGAIYARGATIYSPISSAQYIWIDWDSQATTTVSTMRFNFVYYLQ